MSSGDEKQFPRIPTVRNLTPEDRQVINKLVPDNPVKGGLVGKNKELNIPDLGLFNRIAAKTARGVTDAKNLFQVLPDMDLARQILVSAILSPTELTGSTLLYSVADVGLDSNLTGPMLRVVKNYFETVYRINKLLPEILSDALFMKGSYPMLILPESTIDHTINSNGRVSLESLNGEVMADGWYRPLGLLASNEAMESRGDTSFSFESLLSPLSINPRQSKDSYRTEKKLEFKIGEHKIEKNVGYYVTDNPDVLKNPILLDKLRKQRITDVFGMRAKATMESASGQKVSLSDVHNTFFKRRQYAQVPLTALTTPSQLNKDSVGHPLVMHLPAEAVIPVHIPGNVRQHIGYYVLLDINGNPVVLSQSDDYYADIRSSMTGNPDMASHLMQMANRGLNGRDVWNDNEINELTRQYGQIVEQDLLKRLRVGLAGGEYELGNREEISRLMLSRALAEKHTMFLFVPAELMTYITFDYNEFGVGRSMLEDGKILASLRSVLMFASIMAATRNATDSQIININVPEGDQDPYSTVESMLNMYARVNRESFPVGDTNPADLISHLQNAGRTVKITGNPAFPEVDFSVESRGETHRVVDTDLDEMLRKRHIQMFGLTPETMEAAAGADFATQVVNNNLMLLKRVIQMQDDFKPFMEDFHRTYILNSGALMAELLEIVTNNEKHLEEEEHKADPKKFVQDFIAALEVDLPSPSTDRLTEQMQAYDAYTDAITKALDAFVIEEMFDSTAAQSLHESIGSVKAALIAKYQRQFLRENGILPELDVFNTVDEDDSPTLNLMEEMDDHVNGVLKSIEEYMKKVHKAAIARKKRLDKENTKYDDAMNDSGDDEDADGMDAGGDEGAGEGDDLGDGEGDDMGLDDDAGEDGSTGDDDLNLDEDDVGGEGDDEDTSGDDLSDADASDDSEPVDAGGDDLDLGDVEPAADTATDTSEPETAPEMDEPEVVEEEPESEPEEVEEETPEEEEEPAPTDEEEAKPEDTGEEQEDNDKEKEAAAKEREQAEAEEQKAKDERAQQREERRKEIEEEEAAKEERKAEREKKRAEKEAEEEKKQKEKEKAEKEKRFAERRGEVDDE